MSKKKLLALVLTVAMAVSAMVGCGEKSAETESTEKVEAEKTETAETEESAEKEVITIDHLAFEMSGWSDTFDNFVKDSEVYKKFVEVTGVEIVETELATDQVQTRIANNDLGDLITISSMAQIEAMVESELLLPLNDLVEQYAPNIITEYPDRWEEACNMFGDGNAYFLPIAAGNEGTGTDVHRYLYTTRWDLYKEIGQPEIKNDDDWIAAMQEMLALYPETEDGKKTYGASFYMDGDGGFSGFTIQLAATNGLVWEKGVHVTRDARTNELYYEMTDEGSAYWRAAEYFNKAYHAGILDPDSPVQGYDEHLAKVHSGQVINPHFYDQEFEKKALEADAESLAGFASIPVEGTMWYANMDCPAGWGASFALAIPKTSEYPERIMEMIAYTFSEDGSRMLTSGVEGVHWDYVDGVPTFKPEILELAMDGGDEWRKTGISQTPLLRFAGIVGSATHSDGYHINLKSDEAYLQNLTYTPSQLDYCETYGVAYPSQAMAKMMEEGKMYDMSGINTLKSITETDEEIDRIDAACIKIASEAIPELITTDDFEGVKAATLEKLEAAGAAKAKAFYLEQWEAK